MSQPSVLTAADIAGSSDLEVIEELVPEWKDKDGNPGLVLLHQLNAEESLALTREMDTKEAAADGIFIVLVYCARDREGNHLFTKEDIPLLKRKSIRVLSRLQRIALAVNKMDPASEVALKKD
jgi:hypothetical protein